MISILPSSPAPPFSPNRSFPYLDVTSLDVVEKIVGVVFFSKLTSLQVTNGFSFFEDCFLGYLLTSNGFSLSIFSVWPLRTSQKDPLTTGIAKTSPMWPRWAGLMGM